MQYAPDISPRRRFFALPEFRRSKETCWELECRFKSRLIHKFRECSSQNVCLEPRKRSRADSLSEIVIFYRNSIEQKVSTSHRACPDIPGNYCSAHWTRFWVDFRKISKIQLQHRLYRESNENVQRFWPKVDFRHTPPTAHESPEPRNIFSSKRTDRSYSFSMKRPFPKCFTRGVRRT